MTSKYRILLLFSALVLFLSGCASLTGQAGSVTQTASLSSDLTLSTKTGLGILQLEGQTFEIDADQAKAMLPLWQALDTLSSDSNTTPDEISSLNDQIRETLTAEQLEAIDKMSWNESSLSELVQEYSTSSSQPVSTANNSAQAASSSSVVGAMGGGMPGGAPPDGGGAEMMITGGAGTNIATSHATIPGQSDRISAGGMNLVFAPAVIQLLQSKIALFSTSKLAGSTIILSFIIKIGTAPAIF